MIHKSSISGSEFRLFRDYIRENCGISIPVGKSYLIETRLTKVMLDTGANSFKEFYNHIVSGKDPAIRQKIINAITTNETLWFRDGLPWKALEEIYLPKLVHTLETGEKNRARIWCTAVSTGQEAYSTAICVNEYLNENRIKGIRLSDFEILATDISDRVLDLAKTGKYDKMSMKRGLDDKLRAKYFKEDGSAWNIDPRIHDAIKFRQFNLQDDYSVLGRFDVIFCRYVLIYFTDKLKREILAKIHDSLADGGVLFTGNYVLYELLEDIFEMKHFGNMTYYVKRDCVYKE